jgi:hypothetical protein
MAENDILATIHMYAHLGANPLATLQTTPLNVNRLPDVADGTPHVLWFGVGDEGIVIDMDRQTARGLSGGVNDDCTIQRQMILSPMRGARLHVGAVAGGRHAPTVRVLAGLLPCHLWVTQIQTGCTVVILDWGGGSYSLFHIQPSEDNQFNMLGKKIIDFGDFGLAGYKNAWLKQEAKTIVTNTGGPVPQQYIMVQSLFEASKGGFTQILGVKHGNQFTFYRQRKKDEGDEIHLRAERLKWSTWRWWVPWSSY